MSGYTRIPVLIIFPDTSTSRDVYGGTGEIVLLEAHHLRPDTPSDTVIVFMHPIGGGAYLPMVNALAAAGHHVVYSNSRYRGNDSALIMEKVAQDLGACVRHVRETLGYTRVVLGGWSGGGALSVFYQQQAEKPTLTATPTGDGPDLTAAGLQPADAVLLLASHVSRHCTLTEWTDAAVLDERDPTVRDPDLDLYGTRVTPPYSEEFVARYRAAQIDRNRRITAWVWAKLDALAAAGRATRSSASSCTAPWPTPAGSIPLSTPTTAHPARATSATRAS